MNSIADFAGKPLKVLGELGLGIVQSCTHVANSKKFGVPDAFSLLEMLHLVLATCGAWV